MSDKYLVLKTLDAPELIGLWTLDEFLALRDHDPVFAPVREHGGIGIPLFVREDGRKTFDIDEALSWIGQPPVREEEIVEHRPCCDSCQ